ncbi:MAG: filamentous hemagglutinin N-terminal domain-containing protein [Phycisphaerales bacterium]|nr:filamentous hemagglutinin N-terminal domain-containing protein [Phycisphaerales bacterium]
MKKFWTIGLGAKKNSIRSTAMRRARTVAAIAGEPVGVDGFGRLIGGLAPAMALAMLASAAAAGPEGAQVSAGSASFQKQGNTTVIHAADRTVINYKSFNIGKNETVQFVQPDALARVLNRINSASPTKIDGKLLANGRVFIVNPAGVIFGQGAVINAAGIYAAAGNITDADFVKGMYRFTDVKGSVENKGTIQAGDVTLVGKTVSNSGTIIADRGAVVMASGDTVMVGENGGRVYVTIDQPGDVQDAKAGGSKASGGGSWAVGDVYSLAIRNSGTVKAKTVHAEAKSGVVAIEGKIDASTTVAGDRGGSVKVLGEYVGVSGQIDASGPAGGGEVLIGGNFQGNGAERNAIRTTVTATAQINADATVAGDGGRVIVWSNDQTNYAGHISARGAGEGSHGGFAEVSGKQNLRFRGTADLRGSAANGSLLLDPATVTLQGGTDDGAADGDDTFAGNPSGVAGTVVFTDTGPTTIFESEIEGLVGAATADIVIQATESISAAGTFTGGLQLGATNLSLQVSNSAAAGSIDLSGVTIGATTGNIQILGSTSGNEACTITLGPISTGAGNITISNGNGNVAVGSALSTTGGNIGLTTLTGQIDVGAAGTLTVTGAGNISLNSTGGSTNVNADLASTGGLIQFGNTGTGSLNLSQDVSGATGVTFNNAAAFDEAFTVSSSGGTVTVASTLDTGPQDITIQGVQVDFGGGADSVTGGAGLTIRPTSAGASISVGDAATGTFDLDATDVAALGGGFTLLTIGHDTGTALTTIGTAAFDAPVLIQQGGTAGQIAVTNTAVLSGTGTMGLTAGSGNSGSFTKADGGQITSGGTMTITADSIDLGAGAGTIQPATGMVLQPRGSGRDVVVGGSGTASELVLSQTEIDAVSGETFMVIGPSSGASDVALSAMTFDAPTTVRTGSTGMITVDGAISAASIRLQGPKTFATGSSLTSTAGGIVLDAGDGTVTASSLVLDAGVNRITTSNLDIGSASVTLTADLFTLNGGQAFSGTGSLIMQPSTPTESIGIGTGAGTLVINSTVLANVPSTLTAFTIGRSNGEHAIAVTDASFLAPTTVRTPTAGLITVTGDSSGAGIRFQGVKTFASGASLTGTGGGAITLDGGAGTITGLGLTITADEVNFGSALGGAADLLVQPTTNTVAIEIGGPGGNAGVLDLTDADIGNLTGTDSVTIGRSGGTHAIGIDSAAFLDPTTIRGGVITTAGALSGTGDASFTLAGSSILLGGNITTAGQAIQLQAPVTITATAPTIDTTTGGNDAGANVTATGVVNAQAAGSQGLTIDAGTGGIIDLQGAVGVTALSTLSMDGATLQFGAVSTTGNATFTSRNAINSTGLLAIGGLADFTTLKTTGSSISVTNVGNTFGSLRARTRSDDGSGGSVAGNVELVEAGNTTLTGGEAGGSFELTSTGNVSFTGPVSAGTDLTSTGVDFTNSVGAQMQAADGSILLDHSGAVTINDTVDASINAATQNLTINGSTVDINAAVIADDVLAITADAGLATIGAAATSNAGSVSVTGTGVSVTAAGTITSATTAATTATSGNVSISGAVTGGTTFTSTGTDFINSAEVTATNGALTLTHTGAVTVGDTLRSTAGLVSVGGGAVSLTASDAIDAATTAAINASGNLQIGGNVTAGTSMTLRSGTDGTGNLSFSAAGADLSSDSITLRAGDGTGGASTTATVDAITNAPQFHASAGGATSPATYIHRQDGNIVDSQIANASQFNAATNVQGVNYTLQSDDGSVSITTASKVAGANLTISGNGPFIISTDLDFSPSPSVTIGDADVQSNAEVSIGTGTLTFSGDLDLNGNNLTLTGDELNFTGGNGSVTGTGGLTLQPFTPNLAIDVGTAADGVGLHISDGELAAIGTQPDLVLVTIGRSNGTHAIAIDTVTILDPFVFRGSSATVTGITGTSNGSVTISTSTIELEGNIQTEDGPISLDGAVTLSPGSGNSISIVSLDDNGADITFGSTINSDGTARELIVDAGEAAILMTGAVGGVGTPLASLTATGASITLPGVTTQGAQSYTGPTTLGGDLTSTTAGSIVLTGAATLSDTVEITTNGGSASDDITFTSTITGGGNALTLDSGAAGAIALQGAASGLTTVDATGATISLRAVSSTGNQDYTGATTLNGNLASSGAHVFITGNTTLAGTSAVSGTTGGVQLSGTVTGGGNALTLTGAGSSATIGGNASGLSTLTATGNTISVQAVTTTGNQSYTGGLTINGDLATAGGNVSVVGTTTLAGDRSITSTGGDINLVAITGAANDLTLTAGAGDIVVAGNATGLEDFTAGGATIALQNVTSTGNQAYTGATTLSGDLTSTGTGAIAVTGATTLDGAIAITSAGAAADDVTLNGTVTGAGNALAINAGGGDVGITGSASGLSTLTVTGNTIAVTGVSSTGNQSYTGNTTATGNLATTTNGDIAFTGDAAVSGNLTSVNGSIAVSGDTTLNGSSQNFTTSGNENVTLAAVDGAANLTINAPGGAISVGTVGGTTPVQSFAASGGTIATTSTVQTTGGQLYDGPTTLGGNLTTAGGNVTATGNVALGPAALAVVTGGGSITVAGNVTGADTDLTLTAGTGNIDISGVNHDVNTAGLDSITATGADISTGSTTTDEAQTYNATGTLTTTNQLRSLGASPISLTGGTEVRVGGNLRTGGAGTITVTGPTTLTPASVTALTGGGNITFANDVNGSANGATALTANAGAGTIAFGGDVGTATDRRLASVTASGGAVQLKSVSTTGAQQYGGAAALDGNLATGTGTIGFANAVTVMRDAQILSGGAVTFSGDLNGAAAGQQGLTVNAGSSGIAFQNVGGGTALEFLAATGAITSGNITTAGDQAYTGSLTTTGNLTSNQGAIAASTGPFSVSGDVSAAGSLTADTGANGITIGGATSAASATLTGSSISVVSVTTTADQTYTGSTASTGNLNSGGGVLVTGPLSAGGNVAAGTSFIVNGGAGAISVVGDTTAGAVTLVGGTIGINDVTTTGEQNYNGITTAGGNLISTGTGGILVAGPLAFTDADHTVQTSNGGISLGTVEGGQNLTFNSGASNITVGTVGGLGAAPDALAITGAGIALSGVTTSGAQTYTGDVNASSNLVSTGAGNITSVGNMSLTGSAHTIQTSGGTISLGTVNGASALTLNAGAGSISVQPIGATTPLTSLLATANSMTISDVATQGNQSFISVTPMSLGSTLSTVDGAISVDGGLRLINDSSILAGGNAGEVAILGNINSDGTARSLTINGARPAGNETTVASVVRIGGSIGEGSPLATLQFGDNTTDPNGSTIPPLSTIVIAPRESFNSDGSVKFTGDGGISFDSPADLSINADQFVMGFGQKITVFGNLNIGGSSSANASLVRLGDVSSTGAIVVRSDVIRLAGRRPAPLVTSGSGITQPDIGLDIVGRNGISFSSPAELETVDGGESVTFGADSIGAISVNVSNGLAQSLQFENGVSANSFQKGNAAVLMPLDLRADGRSATNVATAIAGATPKEADSGMVTQGVGISGALKEQLKQVGIYVKELSLDDQVDFLAGRAIYNDVPSVLNPADRDYEITANRLAIELVRDVLEAHRNIKAVAMEGAAADAVWSDRMAEIVASSWSECAKKVGKPVADVTTEEYIAFVQSDPTQSQAKDLLTSVHAFMEKIDALGLSPGEASVPKDTVLGYLAPTEGDVSKEQVAAAIAGIRARN